jgi:hypothetical protein
VPNFYNNIGGKSHKFTKPKRKIGGTRRTRSTQKPVHKKPPIPLADLLDGTRTPEPRDKFGKGLWACKNVEEVKDTLTKWQRGFEGKVEKAVKNRKLSPERRAMLEALLKQPGATSTPILANDLICMEGFKLLHARLVSITSADPTLEVALVTVISGDGETSHFCTEIELFKSQKRVQETLRAISPNFFGITELALFNSHTHPKGGRMIQRHEHALVIGRDVVRQAQTVACKREKKFASNFTNAPVINVKKVATDSVNLARIAAYLFKPPYKCQTWNPPKANKPGHMSGSEKGDRYIRYLRLAQIRSMITIDQFTFGGGEGQRIRSDMIKFLRALATKEAVTSGRVLHPDAVASFWVELTKELKEDRWNLPIIKTQK